MGNIHDIFFLYKIGNTSLESNIFAYFYIKYGNHWEIKLIYLFYKKILLESNNYSYFYIKCEYNGFNYIYIKMRKATRNRYICIFLYKSLILWELLLIYLFLYKKTFFTFLYKIWISVGDTNFYTNIKISYLNQTCLHIIL